MARPKKNPSTTNGSPQPHEVAVELGRESRTAYDGDQPLGTLPNLIITTNPHYAADFERLKASCKPSFIPPLPQNEP